MAGYNDELPPSYDSVCNYKNNTDINENKINKSYVRLHNYTNNPYDYTNDINNINYTNYPQQNYINVIRNNCLRTIRTSSGNCINRSNYIQQRPRSDIVQVNNTIQNQNIYTTVVSYRINENGVTIPI